MVSLDLDNFALFFNGGARSYLFEWVPMGNGLGLFSHNDAYLVKSSKIPETVIEPVIVEYQQLDFKFGGKKRFEDWTISLKVDTKADIRRKFEEWSQRVHQISTYKDSKEFKHKYFKDYKSDEIFRMLGSEGWGSMQPILEIKLFNAWPSAIGPIELDYSSQDFAYFDVTLTYQYHEIKDV